MPSKSYGGGCPFDDRVGDTASTVAPDDEGGDVRKRTVRIDDIPADGVELAEEQLANLLGGMQPEVRESTSGTWSRGRGYDNDDDFGPGH